MVELQSGQAWPVAPWGTAYATWRENDAWYTGDTDALAKVYQGGRGAERPTHMVRGQEREGGVVALAGGISRLFWGRPVPTGQERARLHIPAAGDVATLSADLLFSRRPRIQYGTDDTSAGKRQRQRMELLMGSDYSLSQMQQGGEYTSAFGATALVPVWDRDLADHVWWEPVAADCTIPEFRMGRLTALNLWTEYRDGNSATIYRHIARHEPGAIIHTLYQGTENNLGHPVPLQERPETEQYAAVVGRNGADGNAIPTGVNELVAEWWLNAPAKAWRKSGVLAEAGRSDYAGGVKPLFDALDEAWSSWMRDLQLGKARLVLPRAYLQSNGRGRGASFDTDQELFSPLDLPGSATASTGEAIEQVQFDIRVQEHAETTQALYRRILAAVGQGELDKETASATDRTATEVNVAGQSRVRTRERKALYARPTLGSFARKLMLLDGAVYPGKGGGDYPLPEVVFPALPDASPQSTAQTISLLRAANVQSILLSVRAAHPEFSPDEVDEEVKRLEQERPIADPTTVDRVDPDDDPELQDPEADPPQRTRRQPPQRE